MRVLLATDGSKDARTATVYLRDFPLPEGSRILLLSVVDAPASPLDVPPVREFRAALRAEGRRALEEARRLLGPRGATAEDRVAEGGARAEILRAADEWEADLIVLGARGLGGVRGVLLGSVSSAVAHHARCPVLVVKGRPRPLGGVLIALDGSEHAWAGVRFVLALPLDRGTKVRLLSVVERVHYPSSAPRLLRAQLRGLLADMEKERRAELDRGLARAAAELRGRVTRVTRGTPTGTPAGEIVAAARELDADLVVVGARGRGGIERLLLGSVSERVLRDARCPVLIVKGLREP
ncbi:MAG: hypothetical protein A2W08_05985 [Candidatus Rokubacteria bacterium RBG_16_73_20]|nr:MAG: hypothetical protein A2050_08965 [Candidatus Rokubacteria bacterium GWA2_73_35]OGK96076.1 MAG: hypothetical protein A2W08_05985 [Candidatus Rokubacteria bacterium RBG_16_73_20]